MTTKRGNSMIFSLTAIALLLAITAPLVSKAAVAAEEDSSRPQAGTGETSIEGGDRREEKREEKREEEEEETSIVEIPVFATNEDHEAILECPIEYGERRGLIDCLIVQLID